MEVLDKDIEIKDIQLKSLRLELNKSTEDSDQQSASLEEFEKRLTEIAQEKNSLQKDYDQLKATEDQNEQKKEDYELSLQSFKEQLSKTNRSLDARQNEFNLTKSLVENLEGFPEAIKFLKKDSKLKDAPLLSDIISCDEKYRVAIENFLEGYMNYYIVNTQEDALEAVQLLTDSSRGKANFFILEKLAAYEKHAETTQSATAALSVVDYDPKYNNLIHYLPTVFIC